MRIRQPAGWGLVAMIALATAVMTSPVAAADASLRIEPATVAVAVGTTFSVEVVQEAPVATSGAQASVVFDPRILRVVSVSPGPAYATAPIVLPKDLQADIRQANVTGRLAQVAAAHAPPDAVPPGTAGFLVIEFQVVGCGDTDISLPEGGPFNAEMISGEPDLYGRPVPVGTVSGHVTTTSCAGQVAGITDTTDAAVGGPDTAGIAIGILGALGVIAVGALAGLSWRSRRRERHDHVAW